MGAAEEGVDKIRVICKQRRIRLEEFFSTFDRLKTKKCTAAQFERALDISGVKRVLSKKEDADATIAALAKFYTLVDDPLMVDYLSFCDSVNEVFTKKGLEKVPTQPVALALSGTPSEGELLGLHNPTLPTAAYDELHSLLLAMRHTVATNGMVLKDFFLDFDLNNDGCITKAEFLRNIYRVFAKLNESQAELLIKAYDVGHGVNFRALQGDVESLGVEPLSFTGSRSKTKKIMDDNAMMSFTGFPKVHASPLLVFFVSSRTLIMRERWNQSSCRCATPRG